MQIFGFNKELGKFNEYDIFDEINKILNKRIVNFIFNAEETVFYVLLEDKILYRQNIPGFQNISKGVDKLDICVMNRNIINSKN